MGKPYNGVDKFLKILIIIVWLAGSICGEFAAISTEKQLSSFADTLQSKHNLYQMSIFPSYENICNFKSYNLFMREFIASTPSVSIVPSKIGSSRSLALNVHKNPRAARVLYILPQCRLNLETIKATLNIFIKLAPIPTRPKVLLVLLNESLDNSHEIIFEYAWSLKFFDFSILYLSNDETYYSTYNPFLKHVGNGYFNSSVDLFPDKLRNIHNYPLKIPFINIPPLCVTSVDKVTGRKKAHGTTYNFIALFSEHVSASIDFFEASAFNKSIYLQALIDGHADVTNVALMTKYIYGKPLVLSKIFRTSELVFVVPIITFSRLSSSYSVLISFLCIIAIISCFKIIISVFLSGSQNWSVFHIIQLFLGVACDRQPSSSSQSIAYLTVVFISIIFTNDFLDQLVDFKLLVEETPLSTMDEIYNSGLPVFTYFDESTTRIELGKLRDQITVISNISECYERNQRGIPSVCVDGINQASFRISQYKQPRMKIVNPSMRFEYIAFAFEKGSVYAEKFDSVLTKIVESGITKLWEPKQNPKISVSHENFTARSNILVGLYIILASGFSLAAVVLVIEILLQRYKQRLYKFFDNIFIH